MPENPGVHGGFEIVVKCVTPKSRREKSGSLRETMNSQEQPGAAGSSQEQLLNDGLDT